jgi:hypothetical protein
VQPNDHGLKPWDKGNLSAFGMNFLRYFVTEMECDKHGEFKRSRLK